MTAKLTRTFFCALATFALTSGFATADDPPPVELSAQDDHARLMKLLDMKSIRRGADGNNANAPNAANYDESKANPYPHLPDPLLTQDRRIVDSAEMWRTVRRPEIVELFDREIYGRVPESTPAVTWEVTSTEEGSSGDIATITKRLIGRADNSACPAIEVAIEALLVTPAKSDRRVPVMMQFSWVFGGGRLGGPFPRRPGFTPPPGPTWQEQAIARGWGYAMINTTTIQADNGAGLTRGIIGLANKGQPRDLDDWGALRAWAWGASRLLDYLETDPAVDATKVAIEGHSRYGKAALVAMAYDERFGACYCSSSGEGGAKLHRRNCGEIVENIAGSGEYHWMAGNILKYAGPLTWDDMPVDSHELIALCAPRPVFISSGNVGDAWVDARGMFMATAAAQPVYRLLGKKDMGTSEYPPIETTLTDGAIAYRQHNGGHSDGPNWPTFYEFAGRYFDAEK